MKCYSRDDEEFSHDSLGAMFDEMRSDGELASGAIYYEADCEPITAAWMARPSEIDSLLTRLDDALYEEVGETADTCFTSVSEEAKDELRAFIEGWIGRHTGVERYWRIVGRSRQCTVSLEDADADNQEGGEA